MTILSITHDIEEEVFADNVILLNNGEIKDIGKPEDILVNEKILQEMNLDIPFSLKLTKKLKEKGIKVTRQIDKKELVNELCQLHLKK